MQQREKALVIVILVIVIFWWGGETAKRIVWGPVQDRNETLQSLVQQIDQARETQLNIVAAKKKMARWLAQSLPPQEVEAQRLYQIWLQDLGENVGFSNFRAKPMGNPGPARKGSPYALVSVELTGEGTLNQVRDFLYRFYRTDLLHRIALMKLVAVENVPIPRLKVTMTAEGLALTEAKPRKMLFPFTQLSGNILADDSVIHVDKATDFPKKPPFRVRIEGEYLNVTDVSRDATPQAWTVERGVDYSSKEAHPAESRVELAPVNPELADRKREDYDLIVSRNPFAKPGPIHEYSPHIEPISHQTVIRGTPWSLTVRPTDFDPSLGRRDFRLGESAPATMQIDQDSDDNTAKLTWSPGLDEANGEYKIDVHVSQRGPNGAKISQTIELTLRDPNQPPVLEPIGELTAIRGRPFSYRVQARDNDNPNAKLKFGLGDGAPPGASINASTGEITWSPADNAELSGFTFDVRVTDDDSRPLTTSQSVSLKVAEDVALYTYLTGFFEANDQREAWLYDRSTNRRLILTEGLDFRFADLRGSVRSIERDHVVLDLNGETWRLDVGKNLRSMRKSAVPAGN